MRLSTFIILSFCHSLLGKSWENINSDVVLYKFGDNRISLENGLAHFFSNSLVSNDLVQYIYVPNPPSISSVGTLCSQGFVELFASGCMGSVLWSNGQTGDTIYVELEGRYSAFCIEHEDRSIASNVIEINDNSPKVPIVFANRYELCEGQSAVLFSDNCNGNVLWSNNMVGRTISVNVLGNYSAVCENDCGESTNSNIITLTRLTIPNPPIINTSSLFICPGEIAIIKATKCFDTVTWNIGATGPIITAPEGIYKATCTNICGRSKESDSLIIRTLYPPSAPILISDKKAICTGEVTTITATGCNDATISWSNGDFGDSNEVSIPGSYSAFCSNMCGSSLPSNEIELDYSQPPMVVGEENLTCLIDTVLRTASGGISYSWSNGDNTAEGTIISAGIYTVTVTGENGCSATATTTVVFDNNLVVTASNDGPYSEGQIINLMATGGPSYSWAGPNGFTSSAVNPSITNATSVKAGIYTVTVNNGSCTGTATTNVVVSCSTPGMSYYLAYTDGTEPEVFSPLVEQMEVQVSNRPMTILAVPNCELPVIESARIHISGTGNNHFYIDNELPFSLYETNGVATGEVFEANYYTFIGRGFDQDNSLGNVIVGPDELHFSVVRGDRAITAPTLSTNVICAGSSLTVSSTASGVFDFNVGNVFQAYLSDENGNFGNQILIGSSSDPANIVCSIPSNLPSGNNYKVVVRSSSPIVSSSASASLSITSSSVSLLSPTNDILSGTRTEQAIQTINAQNKIEGSSNVIYKAGNAVILEPGFKAESGTVFSAKIENVCAD